MKAESLRITIFRAFRLIRNIVFFLGFVIGIFMLVGVDLNANFMGKVMLLIAFVLIIHLLLDEIYGYGELLRNIRFYESRDKPPAAKMVVIRLLKLTLASEQDQEIIAGDLLEEFNGFDSNLGAYLWLYKQVLRSVLPLAYTTVKSRLASYFGERIR